jgi:group II intron reverse transcriptase/maturase
MRDPKIILDIYQKRGANGRPLERVYRHLFLPELYLHAYGKIYRNAGALTPGSTGETVDGMCLDKVDAIIDLLRQERYQWRPVRRTHIPKKNGKMRPLGIPTWSDKLVQEVLRTLLETYYEPQFSVASHGFRPKRSCHTALRQIQSQWKGTVWFIEGDIKGCFDNIDHDILLSILRRSIHDDRLIRLVSNLFNAGYVTQDWTYGATESGTPQGGILSPLLANIYLHELDAFVESTLLHAYQRGAIRHANSRYRQLQHQRTRARQVGQLDLYRDLTRQLRCTPSMCLDDPEYRRLHYVRYADDFLLGFIGPRKEAEAIRDQLKQFLAERLKLELSVEKTLITHARSGKAKFLGYELQTVHAESRLTKQMSSGRQIKRRAANGCVSLLMPREAVTRVLSEHSRDGKIVHRSELKDDSDYTIVSRYQSMLRGKYNFYSMAANVSKRMHRIQGILQRSLLKTLACKHQCTTRRIRRKYRAINIDGQPILRVIVERAKKKPLVAIFGGIAFERTKHGKGKGEHCPRKEWHCPATHRAEVVQRLLTEKCELCGAANVPLSAHHVRKLADLKRKGKQPAKWEQVMAARKRKSLMVCAKCHEAIHAGQYDGARLTGR